MSKFDKILALLCLASIFKYPRLYILQNYQKNISSQCGDHILRHVYKEKFFLLEGQLYQERLVFNCFKNIIKWYVENKENAYSAKKTPKVSRGLRQALDPGPLKLTSFTWLHFAPSVTLLEKNFWPPRPQSWVRHCIAKNNFEKPGVRFTRFEVCTCFVFNFFILLHVYF